MAGTVKFILDLSDEVQELVEQQQIDLYSDIQEELPSVRLEVMSDPAAPLGSRDIVPVIVAIGTTAAAVINSLVPLIIRVLNQYKPDTAEIMHEETETHHLDGTVTIHRIHVYTKREYNQQVHLPQPAQKPELTQLEGGSDSSKANH